MIVADLFPLRSCHPSVNSQNHHSLSPTILLDRGFNRYLPPSLPPTVNKPDKNPNPRSAMTTEESILANQDEESRSTVTDLALEEGELEEGEIEGDSASAAGGGLEPALHPLEHSWTLWFDNPSAKSRNSAWGSSIRPVYTFSTVEDFWGLYNNINHPTQLVIGADLHCFKNKIEPKWEDPICANGGKWTITCSRGKSDTLWLYTLLAMIGEQFEYGDEICGAVVSVRAKQERVAIWTKNATNEAAQISIGRQWKEIVDHKETIAFLVHEDVMHEKAPKNRYTV